jgi:hypothetical protein
MVSPQCCRRAVVVTFWLVLSAVSPVRAAEPLTMILLHVLQQQLGDAIERHLPESRDTSLPSPEFRTLPGVQGVNAAQMREMIDTGFVHLTRAQRDEIFSRVMQLLDDPKLLAARPLIVQEIAEKASAARVAHERLASLSESQKRRIAQQTGEELRRLAPAERERFIRLLEARSTPIPRDLNDLILAAATGGAEATVITR